ncbi:MULTISPECIES: DUF3046 domain-containing protein [Corynebacterium]|uniref:DUF3046 domain-containing protein n=1 Tax=Corynebacterium antarcticum TaxID=2800405 RepID=A0A9Q4CA88_9CORY|nr:MULTISPECIES: DUF3046 domain-containing protein [Corynebacterium]MBV7294101.1 DUF3046 domain-containing protein [Corynebacterium sp. TAE3-ERU16]MCK7641614.1 DUF3046 domain-containing protein [Corynebacterium antarcticum]MCK7660288.1 DUF3046 domain-containing protein [Corynebacterium antarcticum]MCX7491215.1 DUF3046 domain-containing protein [Corynebacterium antarcticum]MCX7537240.1 DUF3046 domain-containing protein [Corynebacterium antarcticum]
MRLHQFDRLIDAEFGHAHGMWIMRSHVLSRRGRTAAELIEDGVDPRDVWWEICRDFEIPEERRLGPDE